MSDLGTGARNSGFLILEAVYISWLVPPQVLWDRFGSRAPLSGGKWQKKAFSPPCLPNCTMSPARKVQLAGALFCCHSCFYTGVFPSIAMLTQACHTSKWLAKQAKLCSIDQAAALALTFLIKITATMITFFMCCFPSTLWA